jgi:hypothetical protein
MAEKRSWLKIRDDGGAFGRALCGPACAEGKLGLIAPIAECTIVRQADHGWWHVAGALGLITPESVGILSDNLRARAVRA